MSIDEKVVFYYCLPERSASLPPPFETIPAMFLSSDEDENSAENNCCFRVISDF